MNDTEKNQRKLSIYTSLLLIVVLLIGVSYALFQIFARQSGQNNISTIDCLSITYEDVSDAISLVNEFPITDNEGYQKSPYTFKVTNNCSEYVGLEIGVETLTSSTISPQYIKGSVNKVGITPMAKILSTGKVGEAMNGGTNYIIKKDGLNANESVSYELRLWIDYDTTEAQAGKEWHGKVVVSAVAETMPLDAPENWYDANSGTFLAAIKRDNNVGMPATTPGSAVSTSSEAVLASTEDDYGTSYYFRGAVTNNFVEYANMCWRIVRVTGDGSIKLVLYNYNGLTSANNTPSNSTPCNVTGDTYAYARYDGDTYTSVFGRDMIDNAYVGFMYGTAGASSYADAHANTNPSVILTNLNKWYTNVLSKQFNFSDSLLADTIWCNDKSVVTDTTFNPGAFTLGTNYGAGTNVNYYGATKRLMQASSYGIGGTGPSLICPNDNNGGKLSKFTVSDTEYGNGALSGYAKIGLLTADEIAFAGGAYGTTNSTYYLKGNTNSVFWWALSPFNFYDNVAAVWSVLSNGGRLGGTDPIDYTVGVRPSLSLSSGVKISSGNGSATSPYKIVA